MLKAWLKEHNIEVGEKFRKGGSTYSVEEDGLLYLHSGGDKLESKMEVNYFIKSSFTKIPWKPDKHTVYYTPRVGFMADIVNTNIWEDTDMDDYRYKLGLVCKTVTEAQQKYNKIREFCEKEFT